MSILNKADKEITQEILAEYWRITELSSLLAHLEFRVHFFFFFFFFFFFSSSSSSSSSFSSSSPSYSPSSRSSSPYLLLCVCFLSAVLFTALSLC
jgi:hypothetical protein